jgi:hypothetical protein
VEYKNALATFTIPDRPNVRQQLQWFGAVTGVDPSLTWVRHWAGAKVLIQSWQSDVLPDYKTDLDTISDPSQRELILWVGLEVVKFMNALEDVPKNL